MNTSISTLSGPDWEDWANHVLSCHYGPTEYQRVPDKDRGDAGIEGFTRETGHAYQAYGCEGPLSVAARYEKQRDKMTEDISKFISNREVLQRLFGTVCITRWVLFVPWFDSKEIVSHAAKKTEEVRQQNLPYVDPNFQVCVCDESDFPVATNKLINASNDALLVTFEQPTPEDIAEWAAANQGLSLTLTQKLGRLPTLRNDQKRILFQNTVLKWYLQGQEILEKLRSYPDVYEKVCMAKSHREIFLVKQMANGTLPQEMFDTAIRDLKATIEEEVRELHRFSSESLAYEGVADWLLRCPLDFPEINGDA